MKTNGKLWNVKLLLGLLIVCFVSITLVVGGGDLLETGQVFTKPTSTTIKVTLDKESYIVAQDLITCNGGNCEVVIDGKNLREDSDNLELRFYSSDDVVVKGISVYANSPVLVSNNNITCSVVKTIVNELNHSSYNETKCVNNPYNTYADFYKWFDLTVRQDSKGYYSSMPFFKDESFKVKFVVKNILGKSIKYDVGIGSNILDPLINSSNLYSSNNSFILDYEPSNTTANVTNSLLRLSTYGGGSSMSSAHTDATNLSFSSGSGCYSSGIIFMPKEDVVIQKATFAVSGEAYYGLYNFTSETEPILLATGSSAATVIFNNISLKKGTRYGVGLYNAGNGSTNCYYKEGMSYPILRSHVNYTTGYQYSGGSWRFNSGELYAGVFTITTANVTESQIYYNVSKNIVSSTVFQLAGNTSNFTLNVVENTANSLFNNTYNISCDGGSSYITISSSNLTSGVYSGLCSEGDKINYYVSLGGNTTVSSNVSLVNISFSLIPEPSVLDQFVVGSESFNTTDVRELSSQMYFQNFTYNHSFVRSLNVSFWQEGIQYNASLLSSVNNGTPDFNLTMFNVSVVLGLVETNTTNVSHYWNYTLSFINDTALSGVTSNASHAVEWSYWISALTINNTPVETSIPDYNFTHTSLEELASLVGLVEINVTNYTVTNVSLEWSQNWTIPLIETNTTNITVRAFLNVSYGTESYIRTVTSQDQEISWAYWIDTLSINNTPVETSTHDYNFTITSIESTATIVGIFELNKTNYSVTSTGLNYGINWTLPLVETNTTNVTIKPYINISYGGISLLRSFDSQDQEISYAYWIDSLVINNSVREMSVQEYNFTFTDLSGAASLIGVLQINNTNFTVLNTSNNYGTNWTLPLVLTNTTNITVKPYINISYGGLSLLRSLDSQDQEISWAYWINETIKNDLVFETSNQSYNFSIFSLESGASFVGFYNWNGTNYFTTNLSDHHTLYFLPYIVDVNATNVTLQAFFNLTDGTTTLTRNYTQQQQTILWAYNITGISGNTTIFEGENSTVYLNVSNITGGVMASFVRPLIEWNGTNFSTIDLGGGRYYNIFPTSAVNVSEYNITIRGFINVSYGGRESIRPSVSLVQMIKQMRLDNCTIGNIELINYTFLLEKDKTAVYVDAFGFYIKYYVYGADPSVFRTFNETYGNISFYKFCSITPERSYVIDIDSYWSETGYDTREYRVEKAIINNFTTAIKAYLLDTTNSTTITITVVDGSDVEQEGIYGFVYQYDIINKTRKLLGSEITDVNGDAVYYLNIVDQYYQWDFYEDGVLKLTTTPQKLTATAYTFRLVATAGRSFTTYHDLVTGTTRKISYDNTTEKVSFYYNDAKNLTSSVCLDVYLMNQSNATLLSNQCSSATSANITYTLPYNTAQYRAYAYCYSNVDGRRYPFSDKTIFADFANLAALGLEGMFLGTLFILAYAGIGFFTIKKPIMGVLLGMVGFFACFGLGYFWIGTGAFMGILFLSIIMFVKLRD